MYFPNFIDMQQMETVLPKLHPASLLTLKRLHEVEHDKLAKYAHMLTTKALFPNNIERQNVKLVLQIFNMHTVEDLQLAGPLFNIDNYESTAEYIRIIVTWWNIINVKTLFKGQHKHDPFQEPLTQSSDDDKEQFLKDFLNWLERWERYKCDSGCFTKDTLTALKHTTHAILELSSYLIKELGFSYVLTGKLQTDSLEDRFGYYRQLAGGQYNISITQLYEIEKKLRIQSILPLQLNSHFQDVHIMTPVKSLETIKNVNNLKENIFEIYGSTISVSEEELLKVQNDSLLVLAYLAGYCVHIVAKQLRCTFCKTNLTLYTSFLSETHDLIKRLDHGGLQYPSEEVITIIITNYIVISKLISSEFEEQFLRSENRRSLASNVTLQVLQTLENCLPFKCCDNGHSAEFLTKAIT